MGQIKMFVNMFYHCIICWGVNVNGANNFFFKMFYLCIICWDVNVNGANKNICEYVLSLHYMLGCQCQWVK